MNSLSENINKFTKNEGDQQYASNDSGLSCNSNGGTESDQKQIPPIDLYCDDLTKSLFINSFSNTELIHDDDIYSYKSKLEFSNAFPAKLRSFNLSKSENTNFKNASTFSSIINDVEKLRFSEPFSHSQTFSSDSNAKEKLISPSSYNTTTFKRTESIKGETKAELHDKSRPKRQSKKNGFQEYLSCSIKDYRGDKALNDIVSFIQGSSKSSKKEQSYNKTKNVKTPSIIVDECPSLMKLKSEELAVHDNDFSVSTETRKCFIEVDSGTQSSQFVSLNNSDEDSSINCFFVEDFQEVVSKKQKKIASAMSTSPPLSFNRANNTSNLKSDSARKTMIVNKTKKSGKTKSKSYQNSFLQSKEAFQEFLYNQYIVFMGNFNIVS